MRQLNDETIFNTARRIDSRDARAEYLQQVCDEDSSLQARVEALLRVHDDERGFLQSPPAELGATLDSPPISEGVGVVIGRYKLLEQIGEGGMGVVYMAEQKTPVKRRVALKIIKPGMDSQQVIARFEAERQALAMMDHPNIAKVLDANTTDSGRPYFVMELVKGIPITAYCDQQRLTTRKRLELLMSVCQAVQHAHQKGIIHRDLKPTNVLVAQCDDNPVVKVIDFGVAKALNQELTERTMFTRFGQVVGTLEYMSPEQASFNHLDVDTRSDVYSLGVILYELLTGATPFEKERLHNAALDEVMRIIREEEPPRPSARLTSSDTLAEIAANRRIEAQKLTSIVRGELDWVVMRALEKDRVRRYESASALARDVQRFLDDQPISARPPSASYRFRKLVQRNKAAVVAGLMFLLLLLLGIAGTTTGWLIANKTLNRALASEKLAVAREQEAERERQISDRLLWQAHDLVIQSALVQALEGRPEGVSATLRQYGQKQDIFGDDDDWPKILKAVAYLHGGDYERSQQILDPIVARSPQLIPAVAALSTAHLQRGDWEAGMRLRNRLQDAQPREQFYDLDQLFLGYGLVFLNTRGAVEKLGDVLDRHPTWLACHAMFADALTHLAMDTGDDALMQRALRKSTATLEFAPDNRFALNASLYAHKCAIEFRQIHQKDWDDLEPNARQLAERLLKFPDFGLGHAMCGQVYDVLGHPAADETWMQVLEHGEEMWRWTAAARLYCDRPANELLKVLEQIEDLSIDKYALAAKAYVLTDVPGGKEEAMRIYKTLVKGQPSLVQCYNAVHILLLLGERDMARSAATRWVQESESRKDRTDSTDSEFQEERLLRIVASEELPDNGFHGHLEEVMSHHMLGLMATAKGDREAAENHFGKSIKKPHINIDHYWGEAFLKHMRADENWPRENPHMSGDQSQVSH